MRVEVEEKTLAQCMRMPKLELHAHLNGSIRDSTLLELAEECSKRGSISFSEVRHIILKEDRSLQECFKLFDVIHILATDHGLITRVTKEVIEDFAAENVVYLELRTTPKNNPAVNMTKRSYLEAVIAGVKNFYHDDDRHETQIQVRLLLSIDRRETVDEATETVKLVLEMQKHGIVGIDLSGNPVLGSWKTVLPALELARMHGLPITLHCGEVYNPDEVEAMLAFRPDRIGHACILQESQWSLLETLKIPVEVCFTSNIRTGCVQALCDHHFAGLYQKNHPMIICTDDRGVFSTTLTAEYAIAAASFGLSNPELFKLARGALEFIFAGNEVKNQLTRIFDSYEHSSEPERITMSEVS